MDRPAQRPGQDQARADGGAERDRRVPGIIRRRSSLLTMAAGYHSSAAPVQFPRPFRHALQH